MPKEEKTENSRILPTNTTSGETPDIDFFKDYGTFPTELFRQKDNSKQKKETLKKVSDADKKLVY